MRNFFIRAFEIFIGTLLIIPSFLLIGFCIVWGILSPIRKLIFGPWLSKSLARNIEANWANANPGQPFPENIFTLFSDGESWKYIEGKWRVAKRH